MNIHVRLEIAMVAPAGKFYYFKPQPDSLCSQSPMSSVKTIQPSISVLQKSSEGYKFSRFVLHYSTLINRYNIPESIIIVKMS